MGKGAIAQVMVWETLFVSLFSIATGIVLGLALTKFAELVLLNILHQEINYRLSVSLTGIWMTMGIFALIFLFLLCKDCWKVYRSDPLALLHSENTGEKPPRSHLLTSLPDYDKVRQIYLISAEDYNAVMGTALMPSRGQAYLYTFRCEYEEDTLSVGDLCLRVAGRLNEFPLMPDASVSVIPSLMLVVADYEVLRPLDTLADKNGNVFSSFNWYYAYDVDAPDEVIAEIYRQRDGVFSLLSREDGYRYSSTCRPLEKQSYYMLYGSLFFLGILLSIVFVFAAVLIIYCSASCTHWCTRSRPTPITALSAVMAKNKHHDSGRKVEKIAVQHVSACCYPEK